MRLHLIPPTALFIASLAATPVAFAEQPQCGPFETIKAGLADSAQEQPTAAGTVADRVLILFLSPAKTYTLVVLDADGQGCLVAMGSAWHTLPSGREAGR